eukprot:CAMPEP_0202727718 /NCGR_PEP_ID=MMETSP1385-20130828/185263_1 /ASSEMBLY_ACC=CAM_ASM_000861 /TAXON_ID=933848 /ORGANISM="Elphidium margaritaceum" /LENGTH=372 /DNA_ID=CAMNT_0049393961 /DNA_START=1007 /DNA_END=2125 /DNA_ORIENTATION=-
MNVNKLMFLGPGGSGKSTIFKQLKYLHNSGFTESEAQALREHIYCQITQQMKQAIASYRLYEKPKSNPTDDDNDGAGGDDEKTTTPYDTERMQSSIETVLQHGDPNLLTPELADAIAYIWKHDTRLKRAFYSNENASQNNKILDETTEYFWDELDRLRQPSYVPSFDDILKVRYRTTGVIDEHFTLNNARFHIFDVGGQKSERRKWLPFFNDVKAVIFVISLSSYNELMFEDQSQNAMQDALQLFHKTINNKAFDKTHIILFLNKKDLFQAKIAKTAITVCPAFADFQEFMEQDGDPNANVNEERIIYADANNYEHTTLYVQKKFLELNENAGKKKIYTHLTCAVSPENIENVFRDVQSIVITQKLDHGGML